MPMQCSQQSINGPTASTRSPSSGSQLMSNAVVLKYAQVLSASLAAPSDRAAVLFRSAHLGHGQDGEASSVCQHRSRDAALRG